MCIQIVMMMNLAAKAISSQKLILCLLWDGVHYRLSRKPLTGNNMWMTQRLNGENESMTIESVNLRQLMPGLQVMCTKRMGLIQGGFRNCSTAAAANVPPMHWYLTAMPKKSYMIPTIVFFIVTHQSKTIICEPSPAQVPTRSATVCSKAPRIFRPSWRNSGTWKSRTKMHWYLNHQSLKQILTFIWGRLGCISLFHMKVYRSYSIVLESGLWSLQLSSNKQIVVVISLSPCNFRQDAHSDDPAWLGACGMQTSRQVCRLQMLSLSARCGALENSKVFSWGTWSSSWHKGLPIPTWDMDSRWILASCVRIHCRDTARPVSWAQFHFHVSISISAKDSTFSVVFIFFIGLINKNTAIQNILYPLPILRLSPRQI